MGDNNDKTIQSDNLRGLIQDLSETFDRMANDIREETVFAGVRPSDAKTFMLIARHPRGISELAKAMGISRQAAHKSVRHLRDKGLIAIEFEDGSKRDKIARLTKRGLEGRKVGREIAETVEQCVAEKIGQKDTDMLKQLLTKLHALLASGA